MIDKLCLATHNQGKIIELRAMFAPYPITITSAADYKIPEPDETGTTCEENALIKAHAVMKETNTPTLADDSGIFIDALNGDPGVYSADWMGPERSATVAINRVLKELDHQDNRKCHFKCVLAYVTPEGAEHLFEGRVHGIITSAPLGDKGHGYDPIIIPDGKTLTFGQMKPEEKVQYSHRANAMAKFLDFLTS